MIMVLLIRDVIERLGVAKLFRKTKVDDVDHMSGLASAHYEISRFNIPMDEGMRVDKLNARYLHEARVSIG